MKESLQGTFFKTILALFGVFLVGIIVVNIALSYSDFINQKKVIKEDIINSKKMIMKNQVEFIVSDIDNGRKKLYKKVKKNLKYRVETAYNIAQNLYKLHGKDPQIKSIIVESLRELKFYDIGDQYVFMTKLDGTFLLVDGLRHLEGKNVFDLATKSNRKSIRKVIDFVEKNKVGYLEYQWQDHKSMEFTKKLSYFRYFEPFDCYIGTGVFVDDIEKNLKESFIEKVSDYRFGEDLRNYIFMTTYEGLSLTYPAKNISLLNLVDVNGVKIVQEFIKLAKNGGGYLSYVMPSGYGKDQNLDKIGYAVGIDEWQVYLGTGETIKDIDKIIDSKKKELIYDLVTDIIVILFLAIGYSILFYIYFNRIKQKLTKDIDNITDSFEELLGENKKIDVESIKFREFDQIATDVNNIFESKANMESELKRKELMLHQQAKMAAMGDMLENIAHQWRQPLSTITVASTGIQLKKQLDHLNDEFLDSSLETINNNAKYLSQTIDDFRNFFISNKNIESFLISDVIDISLNLLDSKFKNREITIIKNIEDVEVIGYKNELIQVILILLNNSKDALEGLSVEKMINITVYKSDTYINLVFIDNAGGIKEENITKIFEPYFTTKHKSQGTGIGLYMAREIITKHMKGDIEVVNEKVSYNKNEYIGAKFSFKIPTKI